MEGAVSDQTIATLVGLAVFIVMRVLDFIVPKGRHWSWTHDHSVSDEAEEESS